MLYYHIKRQKEHTLAVYTGIGFSIFKYLNNVYNPRVSIPCTSILYLHR